MTGGGIKAVQFRVEQGHCRWTEPSHLLCERLSGKVPQLSLAPPVLPLSPAPFHTNTMLMHIKRILVLLIIILHHNGDTTRWWYRFPSRMADHRAAISFERRFVGDRVLVELLQVGSPPMHSPECWVKVSQ